MYRVMGLMILGATLTWLALPGDSRAQSTKKRGGPVCEIGGAKSQGYEHWKVVKAEKPLLYKFNPGKTKDQDKLEDASLTVEPVEGEKDAILSDLKKGWDSKAISRVDDVTMGKFKGTKLFMSGTYDKKEKYRMVAYVLDTKDGKVLVKLIGPTAIVGLHQPDVDVWLKDLK